MAEMLERIGELDRIAEALARAEGGQGRLISIEGPAGVGKSVLLGAAEEDARGRGFEVLSATGRELEQEFAFGVVVQLFSALLERYERRERDELFSGSAALARRLFDAEAGAGRATDAFPLLHGLHWLCANIAARRPLLLAIDDVHWADEPSAAFVSYLAGRAAELPLCLALGIRSGETEQGEAISGALAAEGATVLEPAVLSESAIAELVESDLDASDGSLVAACRAATGGNPLFLRELLRALRERDQVSAATIRELAPESVGRMVVERLGRMPEADAQVIRAIAIAGDGADPRLVGELAEVEPLPLSEAIDRLATLGLLKGGPALAFEHPIFRRAVYESIAPAARAHQHLRAARAMAADPTMCERVAAHLLHSDLATQGVGEDVIEALKLAAKRANERGASELSTRILERVLAEDLDRSTRRAVLLELGIEKLRLGSDDSVDRLEEASVASGSMAERAEAALALSTAQAQTGMLAEAVATCDEALAPPPGERELRLALEAQRGNVKWIAGTLSDDERERLRGLEPEVAGGETPAERAVLTVLAVEAAVTGSRPATKVCDLADRALGQGRLLAELGAEHPSYTFAVAAKTLSGDFAAAVEEWSAGVEHSRGRGSLLGYANALFCRAYSKQLLGDLASSESDVIEGVELLPASELITAPLPLATAVNVAADRGELRVELEQALELQIARREMPPVGTVNYAVVASGWLALSRGNASDALERFLDTGERCELNGWTGPTAMGWRSGAALALAALDRGAEGLELAEEELRLARAYEAPAPLGISLRTKGHLLGGAEGVELCREAIDVLSAGEAQLELAKAMVTLGAALRREGANRECREPLREGMDLAHRCGADVIVERALSELSASGARPRRPARRGVDSLSPKERQTTRMAADGLGNREIAEAMFLTRRTVELHLTSSYKKLGIDSRDQLPGVLAEA